MAIGFLRVKPIHVPPTAAAAYRLGTQIADSKDYSLKSHEVKHGEVFAPGGVPTDDLVALYKSMDLAEKTYNKSAKKGSKMRYGKELVVALPRELSPEANVEAARKLAQGIAMDGYIVTLAVHMPDPKEPVIKAPGDADEDKNPHAHLMIYDRRIVGGIENEINRNQSYQSGIDIESQRQDALRALAGGSSIERLQNQDGIEQNHEGEQPRVLSDLRVRSLDEISAEAPVLLRTNKSNRISKRQAGRLHPRRLSRLARLAAVNERAESLIKLYDKAKDHKVYLLDEDGNRVPQLDDDGNQKRGKKGDLLWVRVSGGLDHPKWRLSQEAKWEKICNEALAAANRQERISMAQYSKRHDEWRLGKHDRVTQYHLGTEATALERQGIHTDVGDYNRAAVAVNQANAALARKTAEAAALESALAAIKPAPEPAQKSPDAVSKATPSAKPQKSTGSGTVSEARISVLDDGMSKFIAINRPGSTPLVAGIIETDGGKPRLGPVLDTSQTAAVLATANIEYQKAMSALSSASLGKLAPSPSGGTGAVQRDLVAEMSEESRLEIEEILQMRVNTARMQAEIAADQHRQAIEADRQLKGGMSI